jgi:hypothetical protein
MTTPERFQTYGKNVYATWAKRCDIFRFLTTLEKLENVPTINVDVPDGRKYVWPKTRYSQIWLRQTLRDHYYLFIMTVTLTVD